MMQWPTMTDYQEAIQNPRLCLGDPELSSGTPVLDLLGLPRPITGGFATVYQMNCAVQRYAVRCFLRYHPDQAQRYSVISNYLGQSQLPCMVHFSFIKQGIKIRTNWYPILKMEWVEGDPLNVYIEKNLNNQKALLDLAQAFSGLAFSLKQCSIAHGDLQHGNILISNGSLRLIDYDGMYVPGMDGVPSLELGHRNYQHPRRSENDFGPFLDSFSAWVIFVSLIALSFHPHLWSRFSGGDEHLLFGAEDFQNPAGSEIFNILGNSSNSTVKSLVSLLESASYCPDLRLIPAFNGAHAHETPKRSSVNTLPNWLADHVEVGDAEQSAQGEEAQPEAGASWLFGFIEPQTPKTINVPVIRDRLFISALFVIAVSLGLSGGIGFLPLNICAAAIGSESVLILIALAHRFRRVNVVGEKKEILKKKRTLQKNIRKVEFEIRKLTSSRSEIDKREATELKATRSKAGSYSQKERDEITGIEQELQLSLTSINSELQALKTKETNDRNQLLTNYKSEFLTTQLRKHDIMSASIQGIGPKLKSRLLAHGIRTAGDIIQTHLQTSYYGRYSNQYAIIDVFGRGRTKVEGIGPQKGMALLSWKQSCEAQYKSQVPNSLPYAQDAAIKAKYQQLIAPLDQQAQGARQKAQQNKTAIRSRCKKELEEIEKREKEIKAKFKKEREGIEINIKDQKWHLSSNNWESGRIEHLLKRYQGVTFTRYLKRVLFLRKAI